MKQSLRKFITVTYLGAMLSVGGFSYADSTPHSDSIGDAITDTTLTAKVKTKLAGDDRLNKSEISVTTTNGVVTLSGNALSSSAKSSAEQLAENVDGVKSVDNEIKTPSMADQVASTTDQAAHETGKAVSDSWITTKVKSKLLSYDSTKDVSVTTSNGVVGLSGTVPSHDAAHHAEKLARQVKGVKSVDTSDLKTGST